ncbi:MAG TPA: hypothetical protein VGQ13_05755 [Nitrososphaera sp.]|nr:hypothetical protein [Nitrososphaera sp.]
MVGNVGMQFEEENVVLTCGCKMKIVKGSPYSARYCGLHAKMHDVEIGVETIFPENIRTYVATEADLAKIEEYLRTGHISELSEISDVLGMESAVVAISLNRLMGKGIVAITADEPHKFFSKQ